MVTYRERRDGDGNHTHDKTMNRRLGRLCTEARNPFDSLVGEGLKAAATPCAPPRTVSSKRWLGRRSLSQLRT